MVNDWLLSDSAERPCAGDGCAMFAGAKTRKKRAHACGNWILAPKKALVQRFGPPLATAAQTGEQNPGLGDWRESQIRVDFEPPRTRSDALATALSEAGFAVWTETAKVRASRAALIMVAAAGKMLFSAMIPAHCANSCPCWAQMASNSHHFLWAMAKSTAVRPLSHAARRAAIRNVGSERANGQKTTPASRFVSARPRNANFKKRF